MQSSITALTLASIVGAAYGEFGIQMDAGSSGTRVYVYHWAKRESPQPDPANLPAPLTHPTSEPRPVQIGYSLKVTPGLSEYGTNPDLDPSDAGSSLEGLFAFASNTLSENGCDNGCQQSVPIFLGATAGMRVLPVATGSTIMTSVQQACSTSGFRFDTSAWARIISGEEEGAFGWLAANWLAATLSPNKDTTGNGTIGALDLGGASTQISFFPKEAVLASYFEVIVNSLRVGIYTHSYLYFGRDQALEQQTQQLVAAGSSYNPCFPSGSNDTSAPFLKGSSDPGACYQSTQDLFPVSEACFQADKTRCAFLGEYQPSLTGAGAFYAFSNFVYSWSFLNVTSDADLYVVHAAATKVCSLNLNELKEYNAKLPEPADENYISGNCFSAMYAVSLLEAYGFPPTDTQLQVLGSINGTEVTWAYGSIIVMANELEWYEGPDGGGGGDRRTVSKSDFNVVVGFLASLNAVTLGVLGCVLIRGRGSIKHEQDQDPGSWKPLPNEPSVAPGVV